jgi:glycosyltransferase involved in cell wall biosynthesis
MRALKILFLNPSGQLGGAERSLLDLIASLRARSELSMEVIAVDEGPLVGAVQALGAQARTLALPDSIACIGDSAVTGWADGASLVKKICVSVPEVVRYISRLRQELVASGADLIHTNGFKMHLLGLWARPQEVPVIWHVRDYVSSRPMMARILPLHARGCAAAIANSKSVAGDLRSLCPNLTVYTVYNAVDLDRFAPAGPKADLDGLAGMHAADPGMVRIGMVATMARWKGHEVFLRALSLLPENMRVRGYIIGGPVYQPSDSQRSLAELRTLAEWIGAAHRVGFTGFLDDTAPAIRALDIAVHASTEPEPFGRVIVEAMACGKPVIASAAGGANEIITDGVNALAHPPGDAQALARQIQHLVDSPELRKQLGEAALTTASMRFGRARLAAEVAPIYQKVAPINAG